MRFQVIIMNKFNEIQRFKMSADELNRKSLKQDVPLEILVIVV